MSANVLPVAGVSRWRPWIGRLVAWNRQRGSARQLRVTESVSLGEKRFVAVVQFKEQRFLVGGTGTSLTLLTELKPDEPAASLGGCASGKS